MLGLAKRNKARLLFTSTSEIYGDPEEHPQKETYWGHVNPIGPRACYDEGAVTVLCMSVYAFTCGCARICWFLGWVGMRRTNVALLSCARLSLQASAWQRRCAIPTCKRRVSRLVPPPPPITTSLVCVCPPPSLRRVSYGFTSPSPSRRRSVHRIPDAVSLPAFVPRSASRACSTRTVRAWTPRMAAWCRTSSCGRCRASRCLFTALATRRGRFRCGPYFCRASHAHTHISSDVVTVCGRCNCPVPPGTGTSRGCVTPALLVTTE